MASSFPFENSSDEQSKNRAEEKSATPASEAPFAEVFPPTDRRAFLQGAAAAAASLAMPRWAHAHPSDVDAIRAEIEKRHDESVKRLQGWIRQPSIAAENRGMNEGCELTMRMLREAGFQQAAKVHTDGQPAIFATLDAGAPELLRQLHAHRVAGARRRSHHDAGRKGSHRVRTDFQRRTLGSWAAQGRALQQ